MTRLPLSVSFFPLEHVAVLQQLYLFLFFFDFQSLTFSPLPFAVSLIAIFF